MSGLTHMPSELMAEKSVLNQWPCLSLEGLRAARAAGIISWVKGKRGTAWYRPEAVEKYVRGHLLSHAGMCDPQSDLAQVFQSAAPGYRGKTRIYFIECAASKSIKIGIAQDLKKRLSGLQTGSPENLTLLGWFFGTVEDERAVHIMFHDVRLRPGGEWFRDCQRLRNFIAEKATQQ